MGCTTKEIHGRSEPANAQDVRRVVEERLAALRESRGFTQRPVLNGRGEQLDLPVIR